MWFMNPNCSCRFRSSFSTGSIHRAQRVLPLKARVYFIASIEALIKFSTGRAPGTPEQHCNLLSMLVHKARGCRNSAKTTVPMMARRCFNYTPARKNGCGKIRLDRTFRCLIGGLHNCQLRMASLQNISCRGDRWHQNLNRRYRSARGRHFYLCVGGGVEIPIKRRVDVRLLRYKPRFELSAVCNKLNCR